MRRPVHISLEEREEELKELKLRFILLQEMKESETTELRHLIIENMQNKVKNEIEWTEQFINDLQIKKIEYEIKAEVDKKIDERRR